MKILQILPELNVGGVETGVLDLTRFLVEAGHKSVVVSAGGRLVDDIRSCGGVHYQLPVNKKSLVSVVRTIPRLAGIILKEDIDLVHARSRVPAWIAYFACRMTARPLVTTCHGYYSRHLFSQPMAWAKSVICPSQIIARHMVEDFGVPPERIKIIPRSVDTEKFNFISPETKRGDEFNVGIVGRITPIKGHLYFIKAMAKLQPAIAGLKIWVVGDAPASKEAYKEQILVLVRRLGLEGRTEFLGSQKDIPAIMTHLDLLVLASTAHEAFGRVVIEAQAAGVPVVATKVGGVVDIIADGETGLLIPPRDAQSMTEAALKIYEDKELARNLAHNAYARVKERYSVRLMAENTLDVYRRSLEGLGILVIKFSSLGDIILSTAAIRAIRKKFPGHRITFLVGEESRDILMNCPYIDELLVCDFKNRDKGLAGLLKIGRAMRKNNFDLVIDLQNNRKSHILAALSLALKRYGYGRKLGFLLNFRVKEPKEPLPPIRHQFRVLNMLGINLEDERLELWPTENDERYAREFLDSEWMSRGQVLIGINLSASKRWLTKIWPLERLGRLCDGLSRRDMRVMVTGTADDSDTALKLAAMVKNVKPINACARTTVNQLACLIRRCSVYVSGDSAPLHVAAAVGTALVGLFGPTDPARHMPPSKDSVVIRKDYPCQPCYKPKCKKPRCMESITEDEVMAAIEKLLKKDKPLAAASRQSL